MTRAELEPVEPDATRAREFVAQARLFLADAERETTHLESAVILYWSACISSMDALLAIDGLRVSSGEDSHAVRVEGARRVLGAGYRDLTDRLDEWRRERHGVSYAAITPGEADVAAMRADARDILEAAEAELGRRDEPRP